MYDFRFLLPSRWELPLLGYYAASSGNWAPILLSLHWLPVVNYHYSLCNKPEQRSSHLLCFGSLKSRLVYLCGQATLHYIQGLERGKKLPLLAALIPQKSAVIIYFAGDIWNHANTSLHCALEASKWLAFWGSSIEQGTWWGIWKEHLHMDFAKYISFLSC